MADIIHTHAAMTSYQPFQCMVCLRRFTRHENLKRHAALHSRSRKEITLPCDLCQATFSRPDLRHRHMKRKHAEHEQRRATKRPKQRDSYATLCQDTGQHRGQLQNVDALQLDRSCWTSDLSQIHYEDGHDPDAGGTSTASSTSPIENSDRIQSVPGNPTQHIPMDESRLLDALELERSLLRETSLPQPTDQLSTQPLAISNLQSPSDIDLGDLSFPKDLSVIPIAPESTQPQNSWFPSASQIREGCSLFFTHVSHFLPFLHHPTFDPSAIPSHLLLAMLSLSYQYGEDPECDARTGTGTSLSTRCYLRARSSLSSSNHPNSTITDHLSLVQTYLLLQICAMMYLCGSDSTQGLQMHATMISLARSTGLMQPITTECAHTLDLDSLWKEFIKAESHKRTLFAVHQIDALWYQLLSIPRAISHLEIKHDLPCPETPWPAPSAAQWAHLQLISQQQHHKHPTSMRYDDAVRHFLSSSTDSTSSIPPFDPYGAINITHFLISSAREISGWSTMTGMLSMERFSALRSSLLSLGVFLSPTPTPTPTPSTTYNAKSAHTTATWQTAMIELQMWSPSHTGGIVKASIDTMLQQATELAPSACEFLCEETAKAFQPHVDWFLTYLEEGDVEGEAPWVTLYAYKAFLVAWQLVRGGVPGAMGVVGVGDGDVRGAVEWARRVFARRERWVIGRLVLGCLGGLD
ncbi:transcriptional regulator family: Fungal Specific TF [Aspergillus niger]|nr:transcriptional regulator family: Fungal Specific TF [Aspergillus niger]